MKRIVFLLVIVFSLVGCSDIDNMTDSKYNLEEKVEKNF